MVTTRRGIRYSPSFFSYIYRIVTMDGRIDEQKLINTLKGLLKQFLPSENLPLEKSVKKFLDIKYKNMVQVPNSENSNIFFLKGGTYKFSYNKQYERLYYLSRDLLEIMKMFKLDEDITEEIMKRWFEEKYGLNIKEMYNE
jgi:hypothetical protein